MKRARDIKQRNESLHAAREVLDSDDRSGFDFASCDYRLSGFLDEIGVLGADCPLIFLAPTILVISNRLLFCGRLHAAQASALYKNEWARAV